ncbi:MAG: DUF1822 family protein [Cyanobacteria bacterium J06634_6]
MDLDDALRWVDTAVSTHTGHALREPEIVILRGTWRGLTYEQMASDSEYSTNYLMRDVAPKLWKLLSSVFDRSVGKTNFRVALEAYASANPALAAEMLLSQGAATPDIGRLLSTQLLASAQAAAPLRTPVAGDGESGGDSVRKQGEASHGWLSDADDNWRATGASLLSATSILPGTMYGYQTSLGKVNRWLDEAASTDGQSRLIGIWGLRGAGKTLLVETAVSERGNRFEGVVWRSLHDRPSLTDLSLSILSSLGMTVPGAQATDQLLSILSNCALLVVLEGVEAILNAGSLAGDYPATHQAYISFFQSVISTRSCVILTGIEGPNDLVFQGGYGGNQSVRSLTLSGLDTEAATHLLEAERLEAPEQWAELIARYQGHPLALKSAARVIREIFNGRVDAFLSQSSVLFNGIFRLLSPSFERLSVPELNVIYWLASYDVPLSLAELQETLPLSLRPAELISALDSLKQRSLLLVKIDVEPPTFYLPALVKAYAVHQFMGQFSAPSSPLNTASGNAAFQSRPVGSGRMATYVPLDQVINLSPVEPRPVQLSNWFEGQFDSDWQPLDWLFESSSRPAMRLRSAYHLRDETYVKRCKMIAFNQLPKAVQEDISKDYQRSGAVLLVAVHQDAESLYKVCVQAQPAKGDSVLPERLALKLLDAQQNTLATVIAEESDSFIQLPYFRGGATEAFEIELSLGDQTHTEMFVI